MQGKSIYILYISSVLIAFCGRTNGQPAHQEAVQQALCFQKQADSLQRVVELETEQLDSVAVSQKNDLRIAICDNHARAVARQQQADEWFARAGEYEERYESVVFGGPVSPEKPVATNVPDQQDTAEAVAVAFSVLPHSPYSAGNPIPVNQPLPDGVIYKIQLGAFSKPVVPDLFRGLTPVSGEQLTNGVTKYYVGMFRKYADAGAALQRVHGYGYQDAYVVAFYNRQVIHPERARQLEKQ